MSLREASIFHAKQILKNFNAKKSAFVDNQKNEIQILCLVNDCDEILIHYTYYDAISCQQLNEINHPRSPVNWKLIVWFHNNGKLIQDLCFDPDGTQLLVVCYDNTLHIVPILWILNPNAQQIVDDGPWPFRFDEITSFVVPFSGPHECPNPRTCPNNNKNIKRRTNGMSSSLNGAGGSGVCDANGATGFADINDEHIANEQNIMFDDVPDNFEEKYSPEHENKEVLSESSQQSDDVSPLVKQMANIELSSEGDDSDIGVISDPTDTNEHQNCPYPTSVVWWTTTTAILKKEQNQLGRENRVIIGYSDGSICVVSLAPNCPFIANTAIDNGGGIAKMTICRDTIVNSVSLLINSSTRIQWKLLLEQNSIGYIFPDDSLLNNDVIVQNTTPEDDWQIVIPITNNTKISPSIEANISRSSEFEGNKEKPDDEPMNRENINLSIRSQSPTSIPQTSNAPLQQQPQHQQQQQTSAGGIFPAARARLASLRDLGAKKIGALKLKLIENKIKSNERDRSRQNMASLACMDIPSLIPEVLTTKSGPFFIVQYLNGNHLLSALHSYSDTLSVHSMDISLIPLYIYKIPKECTEIIVTSNIMFTKQETTVDNNETKTPNNQIIRNDPSNSKECEIENVEVPPPAPLPSTLLQPSASSVITSTKTTISTIGVVGCSTTILRIGEDSEFNQSSMLGNFCLSNETIIDLHRVPYCQISYGNQLNVAADASPSDLDSNNSYEDSPEKYRRISTESYVRQMRRDSNGGNNDQIFDYNDRKIIEHDFPTIELDKCFVVTDKSLYSIEFKNHPEVIFLNLVKEGQWKACDEFCKVFSLNFCQCIEYAGDCLLKKNRTTQALLTYNVAKIPPIKTALKLAMFNQNSALMHLCAMALKTVYIIKSGYPRNHTIDYLLANMDDLNEANKATLEMLLKKRRRATSSSTAKSCSDFSYEQEESCGELQMSNSSQFHLSNLLLLTLAEKATRDKQLMPLWNFLVTNKRYHTNMSSVVLAQSGLYSSTIILALNRGAHMDALCALAGTIIQDYGWYSDINEILHYLSDAMFTESIIYLQHISIDYFDAIQKKINQIDRHALERLKIQLNPFSAIFRPVVSQLSSNFIESDTNDINKKLIKFCKHLMETFLAIVIKLYSLNSVEDEISNAFNVIYVQHEENQFSIKVDHCSTISAGFSHCAAIIDGSCYLWGSNGVNCALSVNPPNDIAGESTPKCLEFISNMGLEVHAVKCGKAHTLILTNNGLYSMGSNLMGQLGIGKHHIQALQPMLVREFDGKNISLIEVGQYHNAVYADGELYTWGWGVYGQLGHGNIFAEDRPKIVRFFGSKIIKQISLGHAHTLVLCVSKRDIFETSLFVFGCNIFGQLGTGHNCNETENGQKFLKSLLPIQLNITLECITHIHTKFFTNFLVTKSNKLYTWGASPQLIRLNNQARKRAKLAQRFEETKIELLTETSTSDLNENFQKNIETDNKEEHENRKNTLEKASTSIEDKNQNIVKIANDVDTKKESDLEKNSETINVFLENNAAKPENNAVEPNKVSGSGSGSEAESSKGKDSKRYEELYSEEESTDHLYPMAVDTSDIIGNIAQVSSGLYHNALVTDTARLYTWGKNLEKQLGRESTRCDLIAPTYLELNENILCVECGADFTVILTDHYAIKAFGNNNFGQCGREMAAPTDRNSIAGKLVRLRVSKRVVRLPDTSQCIDQPVEIALPRPKIRMNYDAVRYLKSVPNFCPEFILKRNFENQAPPSPEYISDDYRCRFGMNFKNDQTPIVSSEFIHYCLFIFHGIYDPHKILDLAIFNEFKTRILMLNYYVKEAFSLCLSTAKNTIENNCDVMKMSAAAATAATSSPSDNQLPGYVIRLFEFFTKDAHVVPTHRTDLKYLIHAIFMYFLRNSLSIDILEQFFLANIDQYLFGLAFVLFFNNNNTELERQVQQKYAHLFGGCDANVAAAGIQPYLDQELASDLEVIFRHVSTSFKTTICQRLIEFDKNLN